MNFKIRKRIIVDALNLAARAISTTSPHPILCGIKIVAADNALTLISSDSNISIRTIIEQNDDLQIIDEGQVVIEARYIMEIVRKIESDFVNFEIIDGTLVRIFGANVEFKINGMRAGDYPNISFDIMASSFKINAAVFNELIEKTSFACSDKEIRPVLTGVNFKAYDHKLHVNATDSYRLASKTIDLDEELNFNITVPAKYLNDIYHSISDVEIVDIAIDAQKISFLFNNTMIQTRLLDDVFPDTSKFIPLSFTQKLIINSRDLNSAIDRSSFIKSEGKNIIKMTITDQSIDISSSNQIGSSFETIPVVSFEGNPLEISCSGKYLQDAIKAINSENVNISFSGDLKPMIITKGDDMDFIQLISPVRTYR